MISITIDASQLSKEAQSIFEKGRRVTSIISKTMREVITFGHKTLGDHLRSGSETTPRYRTGRLFRSFKISPFEPGNEPDVGAFRIFSDLSYAPVHERGTRGKGGDLPDITSKRGLGKMLAIPLKRALQEREEAGFFMSSTELVETSGSPLTRAGRLRGAFAGASLRGVGGLFVFKSKSGKAFLAQDTGKKDAPPKLLFILLPKVSIRPRPYLRPTADAMIQHINTNFSRALNDHMTKKTGEGGTN